MDGPARMHEKWCQCWTPAMWIGALTTGGYVSDVLFTATLPRVLSQQQRQQMDDARKSKHPL